MDRTSRRVLLSASLICVGFLPSDPDFRQDLRNRRQAVAERMGNRGILILFSAESRSYTGDVDYEFRQENNLYYSTGIRQSGVTLVLMPQNNSYREILFLPDRNPSRELWTGKMLSRKEATGISGIQNVWSASEFEPFIDAVLSGRPYRVGRYTESVDYQAFFEDLAKEKAAVFLRLGNKPGLRGTFDREHKFAHLLRERFFAVHVKDAASIFDQIRMLKSDYEIRQLRKAIEITIKAHHRTMETLTPGMWEYELEAEIEHVFKKNNSFDWAFPSIVASGPNATVLHYQESQRQAREGELVLIDIGAEYNYYAADLTRTIPVNGKFSPEQAEIYQIVLDAQTAAIALVKPGSSLEILHKRTVEVIQEGLVRLGLLPHKFCEEYRIFFPHGVGHWLGMDVHDVGSRFTSFRPGMVLTVEPGIYVRGDALQRLTDRIEDESVLAAVRQALEKYKNIGVRIEDDVLVTKEGYELLSQGAPRRIAQIETLMQ